MKNKAFILLCSILLLFSACGTDTEGSGEGMGVWPCRVDVDSSFTSSGDKLLILTLNIPPHRPASCDEGNLSGAYVGIEFAAPLPGGTVISGAVKEIGYSFADTLPNKCLEHWQYWVLLPKNWSPGQPLEMNIGTGINVSSVNADGLLIIANIEAHEDEYPQSTNRAIPMQGEVGVLKARR
ncbi:MAG TPA: hypothetical protein ENJ82_01455 [Bacteroidetes bacterium]|nr:hypothetical protein [Bacteroidota bacterium]